MEQDSLKQLIIKIITKLSAYSLIALHTKPFPIGVSNRHIHLCEGDLELLFGLDYKIQCQKDLSQPGQCAAFETVIIAGPKGCIEQVRVLGPVRKQTQVEVSRSDTFRLGISAPTRESGNLKASGEVTVIGPKGSIQLKEGAIVAKRHLHMSPEDAATYGVVDNQAVQVKVLGDRGVTFDNVVVRVSEKFVLEFHIDMDEANGAGIKHGETGYLLTSQLVDDSKVKDISSKESLAKPLIEEPQGLITEETVRQVWKKKAVLTVNKNVICTPLARDTIKELGVEVIWK